MANAVGAAIASVSGGVDTIEILQGKSLSDTLTRIKQQAIDIAVNAGADRATTRIADIDVLPVQVTSHLYSVADYFSLFCSVRDEPSYTDYRQSDR